MFGGKDDSTWNTFSYKSLLPVAGSVVLFLTIISACSPQTGSKLVRFFFDGVPEKENKNTAVITGSSPPGPDKKQAPVITVAKPDTTAGSVYIHPPYKERACTKCHQNDAPGAISYSQDEFCYGCHKNYNTEYSNVHGPVAGGFCTNCHTPHKSTNKKMLVRTGQDICITCHTKEEVMKSETHADIGKSPCTECHNPHGGSDRYFSY